MSKVKNARNGTHVRQWLGAAALVTLSLSATAQTSTAASDAAFGKLMSQVTGAGKQTVGFGSNGTPLAAPGIPSGAPDGGPGVKVTGTGSVVNPSGNRVPVAVTGRVSNAVAAAAIGKALLKQIPGVANVWALTELATELGYGLEKDASGATVVRKVTNPSAGYSHYAAQAGTVFTTRQAACDDYQVKRQAQLTSSGWVMSSGSIDAQGACHGTMTNAGSTSTWSHTATYFTGLTETATPATAQQLADAIASKSGWPTSSAFARAVVQATGINGEPLPVDAPTVTGPATSPGTTKTSTGTNPDGSTKTTTQTTTHNHNYTTNNITTTTITNTTITNNGSTGVTTTTSETATPETKPEPNPCEADPTTLGCSKLGDAPTEAVPKKTENISYQAENLGFGNGQCPAPASFTTSTGTRSLNFTPICNSLSSIVKPLVLAFALLAAIFIIAPVRTDA